MMILLGIVGVFLSVVLYAAFINPMVQANRLKKELTNLLPTFHWEVAYRSSDESCVQITFDTVPFFLELEAGLADNGIYAYNALTIYGIGIPNEVHFKKGQNVFKAWVEFKKFIALCKSNGVKLLVSSDFESDYKEFKKQIESLNNLQIIESNAEDSK